MKINEGKMDRIVRVVVGIILIATAATGVFSPWGYIGVVPVLTGAMGWCPLYTLLGINTCSMDRK